MRLGINPLQTEERNCLFDVELLLFKSSTANIINKFGNQPANRQQIALN